MPTCEPAVRCAAVQLMENKTHKDLNYKPAKERARERNGVFKLLHILFREKRKQEENNFFKIVLLERRKEEQISMNSRKNQPERPAGREEGVNAKPGMQCGSSARADLAECEREQQRNHHRAEWDYRITTSTLF